MRQNIKGLDERRLRAIMKNARFQKKIPPSMRFAIAIEHIEGLRRLKTKLIRIKTETIR